MTLSKRHYVLIAEIISRLPEPPRQHVAEHFARELRGTNPNYKPDTFLKAATKSV